MASVQEWKQQILSGHCDKQFTWLYQTKRPEECRRRYAQLLETFSRRYGEREQVRIFSAPGRTELCGNHTDHQQGRALAASVTMDKVAVVAEGQEGPISIWSPGYPVEGIDWRDLSHHEAERGHSPSLIRGMVAGFQREGLPVGGFTSVADSCVLAGSGLSSSASFELLIATILDHLYHEGKAAPELLAAIGQYAENTYFGKPCGQMDQLACAVGNAVLIDLKNPKAPEIESLPCAFERWGYALYVVNAGGSHSDLGEDYAAVPREMKAVAACFGKEVLREVEEEEFRASIGRLRSQVPDRALLRAMHFFEENNRVLRVAEAIRQDDAAAYCREMIASGRSSFCRLQNVYPEGTPCERSVALALALCEDLLSPSGGWRIHGGGFAGTVQALVPFDMEEEFCRVMTDSFGEGCCFPLHIRPVGGYELCPEDTEWKKDLT